MLTEAQRKMKKLTKAQRALLDEIQSRTRGDYGFDGRPMFDGREALIASRLAEKGYVNLPAGHGFVFGSPLGVTITPAGRAALEGE